MSLSPQQIAAYAYRAGFRGADLVKAVAIALAESGGDPNAYNPENAAGTRPGSGSRGLWQIYGTAHPQYNNDSILDPQANANAAFAVYREAGNKFTPWTTWTKGIASKIIPTLPKFQLDFSAVGRAASTVRAVNQMAGSTIAEGVNTVTDIPGNTAGAVQAGIASGATAAIEKLRDTLLGKTTKGEQREGLDLAVYLSGLVMILLGVIFLFLNTGPGKATAALAGEGVKVAATGGLAKVL